tara:strand:- start:129 stop:395 length:267 start_codon:yes stop_codon:yes gene_type:complete
VEEFNTDPNQLPEFKLPEKLLEQIYEFSGSGDHSKGFLLIFVGQQGNPLIYSKTENQIIEMGLRKAVEQYLRQSEEADIDNNLGPVDE